MSQGDDKANGPQDDPFPSWDQEKPKASLAEIYQWSINKADENVNWYKKRRKKKKWGSQIFRGFAIFLGAVGGVMPLLNAAIPDEAKEDWPFSLGDSGYVFIALAAAILLYDKYFGLSSGWIRYVLTELSLAREVKEFNFDWATLRARDWSKKEEEYYDLALSRLKAFTLRVDALVKEETEAWAQEFQRNLADLEKSLKADSEARKPGNIKIQARNAREFDRVVIYLDDSRIRDLSGETEYVIRAVPPGFHTVSVVAEAEARGDVRESRVVQVRPGALSSIELTLPKPTA